MISVMTRVLAALLVSITLLTGGTSAASTSVAADAEMSDARAGRVYLDAVCPSIRTGNTFYRVVWHGRKTIPWAELNRRLPEIRRASLAYGRASQRASRKLFNPPAAWPADVDALVTKMANADSKFAYWMLAMSEASTGREWGRYWVRAKKVPYGNTWGSQVRARLGLPPAGEGC